MTEWLRTKLGDVCPFVYGKSLPSTTRDAQGKIPVYGSNGEVGKHTEACVLEPGVIVGRKGSVGEVHFSSEDFWPIDTTFYVVGSSTCDVKFAYYLLKSLDLRSMNSDSAIPGLNRDAAHSLEVSLPPLAEQRAIAGVLGALDDKIESNRRIVHQLNQLLLAHSISLSTLPVVPLREVSQSYRRPVNPLVLGDQLVDHFSLPAFDATAMPERCRASSIMSGKFGIETTSILISRLNPGTPRVWCVQVREVPAMCSSEFLVLEPLNMSTVGALWLAAVHPTLGEQMVQRATGTSFSHQRIRSDDALSVEVPDIRLIGAKAQAECDDLLSAVGKRRDESQTLARLRDALLPELLSGRLRVRDAESLLEGV